MDYSSASGAYGFVHGAIPVGAIAAETSVGDTGGGTKGMAGSLSLGTQNPLFWLLLLFLVFTGWIFGAFDFALGAKKVGSVGFKAKAG